MDLALAWALRLEGKPDQEKFKELGWGLPREIHVNAGQTYFRNCWKDFANRKKIIMKQCLS
jgi:hypothetical protein